MIKFIKSIKNNLICSVLTTAIQLSIVFFVFLPYLNSQYQQNSINRDLIKKKIDSKLYNCQSNYWLSWIVVSGDTYYFEDVRGWNNPLKNTFSIKDAHLNDFYWQQHSIDKASYEFMSNMDTGMVYFTDNIENLKDKTAIYKALTSTNKTMYSVALSLTRDLQRNIIYVFAMTSSSEKLKFCKKEDFVNSLEDISIYARGKL